MNQPPVPIHPDRDPWWRLAYLITGDRQLAAAVGREVQRRVDSGEVAATAGRALVAGLARAQRRAAGRVHDPLWTELRPLPPRRRAEIVLRLPDRAAGSVAG